MSENARIAEPAAVYGVETEVDAGPAIVSVDRINGRFAPGNHASPGRPRKGQSIPEKLKGKVERHADKVVEAAYQRMLREDQVGNRALEDGMNRIYGKVADEMHITTTDSPLAQLFERLAGTGALPAPYIDGESRDITSDS